MTAVATELPDLAEYRERARDWLAANLEPRDPAAPRHDESEATIARAREIQRRLYDGGYGGVCFPVEYGGQGLPAAYQLALSEEGVRFEMPFIFSIPTLSICAATLLDCGTERQKREHLPRIFRGETIWVQMLSEPSGGSDLAAVRTRADRHPDGGWVLSGSKIWTSYAQHAQYALCLARTDWDVPKHAGLTMFIVDLSDPAVEIRPIEMVDGTRHFCQEFVDGLHVGDDAVVGEVNGGWDVATTLLGHERLAVGGASPYANCFRPTSSAFAHGQSDLVELARHRGLAADRGTAERIARAEVLGHVQQQLAERTRQRVDAGERGPVGSVVRLFGAMAAVERATLAFELAGDEAVVSDGDDGALATGIAYLRRQASCMGGGTTEMSRNVISERLLGMPREAAADRGVPFREIGR